VPKAIEVAKQAIEDGNSVVLGLQATGEIARQWGVRKSV
jgi:hypothetical protein